MADRAAAEYRDVGGAAADVHHAHAEILFVFGEHGVARGELLQHDVVDREAAALHAFDDVLRGAVRAGDDVHLGFEAHSRHADGIADAFLAVDDVFLRQHVQDLLIRRNGDRLGRIDDAFDIALHHFLVLDGDDAVRIEAAHVAAGDAGVHRVNFTARHQFGLFHGPLDRLHRGFDVHHDALLQAARRMAADADDFKRPSALISPTMATTLLVPMSRPTNKFRSERLAMVFEQFLQASVSSLRFDGTVAGTAGLRQPMAKPFE